MLRKSRNRLAKFVLGTGALVSLTVAGTTGAAAADGETSFIAHYQHNALIEANLLLTAQSATANVDVSSVKATVSGLNDEIVALYQSEQALANGQAIFSGNAVVSDLLQQRKQLVAQAESEQAQIHKYKGQNPNDTNTLRQMRTIHFLTTAKIQVLDLQLRSLHHLPKSSNAVFALDDLQALIYRLQAMVIWETGTWITQAKALQDMTAASVSGLSYVSSSVNVPDAADGPLSLVVAAVPMVKNQSANILPAAGKYSIAGPDVGSNVNIDPVAGTVTVKPGAARGNYTVTYSQDGVMTTYTLTLS